MITRYDQRRLYEEITKEVNHLEHLRSEINDLRYSYEVQSRKLLDMVSGSAVSVSKREQVFNIIIKRGMI